MDEKNIKDKKVIFRATPEDQKILKALSENLQRNKSDTIRFILRRAFFSLNEQLDEVMKVKATNEKA